MIYLLHIYIHLIYMFPNIIKYQKSIDFIPKCSNKTNEFMIIKTFSNLHF